MPHTVAENLTRLVNAKTAIGNAITAKGGTVGVNDGLEEFANDIGTIPSGGGGSAGTSDVNFYDYDGTIVDSYTASEFAALTAMPSNPSHEGLTAQGWNWSLTDAKTYVAKCGKLNIGQMYNTDDGALRIYIRLGEGRLSPVLGLCPDGTLTVDWGDGSATETMTGSSTSTPVYLGHTYASAGEYVISVLPSAGSKIGFEVRDNRCTILCKSQTDSGNERRVYNNSIYRIEMPDSVTSIGNNAFNSCSSLSSITIPDSVIYIGNAFGGCSSLSSITIPSGVTSMGISTFQNCFSLSSITIPSGVTSMNTSTFQNCSSLSSITIPDSVKNIDNNVFNSCSSLSSVTIPDRVKSIGSNAFGGCSSLSSVTIPDSVKSINIYAFNSCYGLGFIKFISTTPPMVLNSSAWNSVPTDCIIYVPTGYLENYESATNYPDPDTYQYVEY